MNHSDIRVLCVLPNLQLFSTHGGDKYPHFISEVCFKKAIFQSPEKYLWKLIIQLALPQNEKKPGPK